MKQELKYNYMNKHLGILLMSLELSINRPRLKSFPDFVLERKSLLYLKALRYDHQHRQFAAVCRHLTNNDHLVDETIL